MWCRHFFYHQMAWPLCASNNIKLEIFFCFCIHSLSSQVNLNTTMMSTGCFPLVMSVSDMLGLPQLRQAEQLKNGFQQQGHQHQKPPTQEQRRCVTPKQCKRAKQQLKYRNILPKPLLHSVILNNPQAIPTGNVVLCQAPNGQRTLVKVDPISAQPPVPVLVKQNECGSTQTITDVNTQDVHTQTHLNKQVQFQNHAETQTLAGSVQIHNPKQCQSVTGTQRHTQVQCLPFQRQTHTQTQLPVPISMHTQTSQLLTSAQTQTHAASVQLSSQGPTQEADMCEIETQTPDLMVDSSQTLNRDIDQPYSTESGKTEQSLHQTAVDSAAESGLLSLQNSIQNLANSNSQGGCLVKSIHTGTDVTDCSEDFSTFDTIPPDIHTQTPVSSLDFDFSDMRFSSSVQTLSSAFTSVEDNETQTLISSLDLDLADSGTQTQSFLDEMLCSASFSDTETQTWLSNWPITDSGTENQILEELVHMETQTIPLLPELEDITLTDTHTQTFQDDFVGSMLLSTNVQTQTCVARQDLDVINNMSLNSTCSTQTLQRGIDESCFESTDVQTQTLTFPSGTESSIFGRRSSATLSNTETQTHIGALT